MKQKTTTEKKLKSQAIGTEKTRKTKILVIRPDRIGDVVLSTPVFEALNHYYPEAEIYFLVQDAVVPVVENNEFLSGLLVYRPTSIHSGFSGFLKLIKEIRQHQFDIALTLQVNFKVSFALMLSGVRYRVGPYSKWYSYFCFNRGMRQNRSEVEMHEADYNLMLLRKLGTRISSREFETRVMVTEESKAGVAEYLKKVGLAKTKKFAVVHPGMGGSALNWPEGYYIDLVKLLAGRGLPIVVTGSNREKNLVERVVKEATASDANLQISAFLGEDSPRGIADFIAMLDASSVVVAPSTGPLHLAVALQKPTVSFFPPIKVQSALRWGPYTKDEEQHSVMVPDALCGQNFKCAGPRCTFYFCMERLAVEEAAKAVMSKIEGTKKNDV